MVGERREAGLSVSMVRERREAGRKGKGGRSERIYAWSEGEGRQV